MTNILPFLVSDLLDGFLDPAKNDTQRLALLENYESSDWSQLVKRLRNLLHAWSLQDDGPVGGATPVLEVPDVAAQTDDGAEPATAATSDSATATEPEADQVGENAAPAPPSSEIEAAGEGIGEAPVEGGEIAAEPPTAQATPWEDVGGSTFTVVDADESAGSLPDGTHRD